MKDGTAIKDFHDRVAVITGAASGLGRSLALQLYADGARLALCDVDMPGLEETLHLPGDTGQKVSLHSVNVAERDRIPEFAAEVLSQHGQADILVNNAGDSLTPMPFNEIPADRFDKVLSINMWGSIMASAPSYCICAPGRRRASPTSPAWRVWSGCTATRHTA